MVLKVEEKIDILLTTYNTKIEYLKEQIDSILKQTYKNFNLLISDDCSNNGELKEILKEYKEQDKRIKLFFQEKNLGYNKNFEFLLEKSTENYIMFSDHDDIWYPEKIEKCLKKIKEEKVDLVYCNSNQIDENGSIINNNYFKYKNMPLINGKGKLAISRYIGIGCSQIITKKIKEKMLPFKKEVIAHDWLASFLANEENGITYIDEPLFGYRLHNANVFGGRSFSQNKEIWKKENGNSYKSYLKYRNEKVIHKAYLDGAIMCEKYLDVLDSNNEVHNTQEGVLNKEDDFSNSKDKKCEKFLKDLINYYNSLLKSKYINFHIFKYFRFLAGKNLLKKMVKEIVIFHFPAIGYLVFKK